jgi:LysR family transcriptional activator of nhaA
MGEFEDSALIKAFGQAGKGIFASPSAIERQIRQQYKVSVVGQAEDLQEHFYAITVERRLKHPAVLAISEGAKQRLFAQ